MVNQALAHNRVSVWPQGTIAYVNSEEKDANIGISSAIKILNSKFRATARGSIETTSFKKKKKCISTTKCSSHFSSWTQSLFHPHVSSIKQRFKVVWAGQGRPVLMAHPQTFSPSSSIMNSYFHYKHICSTHLLKGKDALVVILDSCFYI